MDRDIAAAYLSRSTSQFDDLVRKGVLPAPSRAYGARSPVWPREVLDKARVELHHIAEFADKADQQKENDWEARIKAKQSAA